MMPLPIPQILILVVGVIKVSGTRRQNISGGAKAATAFGLVINARFSPELLAFLRSQDIGGSKLVRVVILDLVNSTSFALVVLVRCRRMNS